jgi:MFS family permease
VKIGRTSEPLSACAGAARYNSAVSQRADRADLPSVSLDCDPPFELISPENSPMAGVSALSDADVRLLFAARCLRMFAYGFLSVVLVIYLTEIGLSYEATGSLLMLTLWGDTAVSLWMTTAADRIGRKRMLIVGGLLMAGAGAAFAVTREFHWLLIAAIIGVISPGGKEVGPFLSIEQASLAQLAAPERRTMIFAWYNLAGSIAASIGAYCAGLAGKAMQAVGAVGADVYRPVVIGYAVAGGLLVLLFAPLSRRIETTEPPRTTGLGLHRSRKTVFKLSALFALDALAGGLIMDSVVADWLNLRFEAKIEQLGKIFFWTNLFGGLSGLAAARLAARFGLLNTMVFTHLPSNVMLLLVPLMPSLEWAVAVLILRCCISQMDIPTRQAYVIAVVDPDERSAASGMTMVARSLGAGLGLALVGAMLARELWSLPFFVAGGLKIVYDLWLYREFRKSEPVS